MKKQNFFSPHTPGAASLVATLGIICLTVFSLISLTTALAQQRLAEENTKAVTEYYTADLQAEEIFARLRGGEIPQGVEKRGNRYAYKCDISANRVLLVELEETADNWTVIRWQEVAYPQPVDESLSVWQG